MTGTLLVLSFPNLHYHGHSKEILVRLIRVTIPVHK
jgi:hypothetical protein